MAPQSTAPWAQVRPPWRRTSKTSAAPGSICPVMDPAVSVLHNAKQGRRGHQNEHAEQRDGPANIHDALTLAE